MRISQLVVPKLSHLRERRYDFSVVKLRRFRFRFSLDGRLYNRLFIPEALNETLVSGEHLIDVFITVSNVGNIIVIPNRRLIRGCCHRLGLGDRSRSRFGNHGRLSDRSIPRHVLPRSHVLRLRLYFNLRFNDRCSHRSCNRCHPRRFRHRCFNHRLRILNLRHCRRFRLDWRHTNRELRVPRSSRLKGQHTQKRHGKARVFVRSQIHIATTVKRNLVVQLQLFRRKDSGQFKNSGSIQIIRCNRFGNTLRHGYTMDKTGQVTHCLRKREALHAHFTGDFHHASGITLGQTLQKFNQHITIHDAQHLANAFERHRTTAGKSNGLVQKAQTVSHRTTSTDPQQLQSGRLGLDTFLTKNCRHVISHDLRRHITKIELQTARQDRHRHLLRVGRCQNKFHILRRFFERLEHGVKGMRSQLMDFVNHVDLVTSVRRCIHSLLKQRRHFFNGSVTCRVHFDVIDKTTFINRTTGFTDTARMIRHAALSVRTDTIEALGQNTRKRRLTDTARTGKEISMVQAIFTQCVCDRFHDGLLPDHAFKIMRAPFARQDLIRHYFDPSLAAKRSSASPVKRQIRQSSITVAPSDS